MRLILLFAILLAIAAPLRADGKPEPIEVNCTGYQKQAVVFRTPGQSPQYELTTTDGVVERLTSNEFADRLVAHQRRAAELGWIGRILNANSTTELAWIVYGLLGGAVFAGRMVIQWIVSEHRRESVVLPIFWWMSVIGSTMLLIYFVWRGDIVGMLGQGLPLVIYVRNLMLIYGARRRAPQIIQA